MPPDSCYRIGERRTWAGDFLWVIGLRSSAQEVEHHRRGLAGAIRKALREAEAAYRAQHPEAGAVSVLSELYVYAKRPKGFSSYPADVTGWFLTSREALREPNTATVARLQAKHHPFEVPPNLLTRPLPPKAIEQVRKVLTSHGKNLDLKANDTLSKIKRALRAAESANEASSTYQAIASFGAKMVVVNGVEYPTVTHQNGYRRIRVGRDWLRCDVLEALLQTGS